MKIIVNDIITSLNSLINVDRIEFAKKTYPTAMKVLGVTVPNEKIIYIGLDNKEEAYYLCGVLSSSIFRELIDSFKVSTQIAPSTIKNLNIPKYNFENDSHTKISLLCEKGHNDIENIDQYINDIDNLIDDIVIGSKELHKNKVAIPAETLTQSELIF